jgi:hypothetical protein
MIWGPEGGGERTLVIIEGQSCSTRLQGTVALIQAPRNPSPQKRLTVDAGHRIRLAFCLFETTAIHWGCSVQIPAKGQGTCTSEVSGTHNHMTCCMVAVNLCSF